MLSGQRPRAGWHAPSVRAGWHALSVRAGWHALSVAKGVRLSIPCSGFRVPLAACRPVRRKALADKPPVARGRPTSRIRPRPSLRSGRATRPPRSNSGNLMLPRFLLWPIARLVRRPVLRHITAFEEATHQPQAVQEALLQRILARHADTDFGRKHGFHHIQTTADFRRQLPVAGYD